MQFGCKTALRLLLASAGLAEKPLRRCGFLKTGKGKKRNNKEVSEKNQGPLSEIKNLGVERCLKDRANVCTCSKKESERSSCVIVC